MQIDIDPAEINKNIKVDMSVVGDIKVVLEAINAGLDKENHNEWMNHIYEMKKEYPLRYNKDVLSGPYLMEKIFEITEGNAIITTEVGQHPRSGVTTRARVAVAKNIKSVVAPENNG